MTFLSGLATLLAILLMVFGVNLTETGNAPASQTQDAAPHLTDALPSQSPAAGTQGETPAGTASAPDQLAASESWLSQADALRDAQTLVTSMFNAASGERAYTPPAFVSDTDGTRLAVRWVDYLRARTALSPDTKLAAFKRPGVVPVLKGIYADGERLMSVSECLVSMQTASAADYESSIVLKLIYERDSQGRPVVVNIDISGDSDFDALKSAAGENADAAKIDGAVDAAIAGLG